ncbi:hypothetical protein [Lysinibacillus sp. NPDC056185]|uniref:hypothetical protein n=1 Tax=Lysinibacillus sp. NPDC056185 TaxID=3345739 RepID=UPI0039EEDF36
MGLLQSTEEIINLLNYDWTNLNKRETRETELKFNSAIENFNSELINTTDSKLLEQIIKKDKQDFILPIEIMFKTYQRLIEIRLYNEKILLDFAEYLKISGPDWDEEANEIVENVKIKQLEVAVKIAKTVDYNKYQHR